MSKPSDILKGNHMSPRVYLVNEFYYSEETFDDPFLLKTYVFSFQDDADKFLTFVRKTQPSEDRVYTLEVEKIANSDEAIDFYNKTR